METLDLMLGFLAATAASVFLGVMVFGCWELVLSGLAAMCLLVVVRKEFAR